MYASASWLVEQKKMLPTGAHIRSKINMHFFAVGFSQRIKQQCFGFSHTRAGFLIIWKYILPIGKKTAANFLLNHRF